MLIMVELIPENTVRLFQDHFNRMADSHGILPTNLLGNLLRQDKRMKFLSEIYEFILYLYILVELSERIPQKKNCRIS